MSRWTSSNGVSRNTSRSASALPQSSPLVRAQIDDQSRHALCDQPIDRLVEPAAPVPLAVVEPPVRHRQERGVATPLDRPDRRVAARIDAGVRGGAALRQRDAGNARGASPSARVLHHHPVAILPEQHREEDVEGLVAVVALHREKPATLGIVVPVRTRERHERGENGARGSAIDRQDAAARRDPRGEWIGRDDHRVTDPEEVERQPVGRFE
ncbi:hypothetical protein [Sphingomonas sp. 22R3R2A-7]|uniref:hypothetical protein n=1 Tax=Sphingomonas sp. 22R3R2A-7 TaxID=3050230 RepID=UPI002FE0AA78